MRKFGLLVALSVSAWTTGCSATPGSAFDGHENEVGMTALGSVVATRSPLPEPERNRQLKGLSGMGTLMDLMNAGK
jgi:hypothetical protein